MIQTIRAYNPQDFDQIVNDFERSQTVNGISRVFAIQTHIHIASEGGRDEYIAVIFYREAKP
jgi:hypothetical protein